MNKRTMVKKVNVYAPIPIRTVTPPIHGRLNGVAMTPANILKCLIGRATVHEVLSDGSLLRLNNKNYNTVNKPVVKKNYPAGKVVKQESAIEPGDIKKSNVILKDEYTLKNLGKTEEVEMPEVNLADAEPGEIVMESKPNLDYDPEAPAIMVEYNESTSDEISELAVDVEPQDEDTEEVVEEVEEEDLELAQIRAEIEKMEAEEKAAKGEI